MPLSLKVASRGSLLALAQVEEVLREIRLFHPAVVFDVVTVTTKGDQDRTTSLRTLDKTNFFTQEIDALQLALGCRIAIHSAKDLPEPLAEGLQIVALTKGVDPADALVLGKKNLSQRARIGLSSKRREEAVRKLLPEFQSVDVRGTVVERLALLDRGEVEGIVIAEAALIRLQLLYRKRILLSSQGAPLQGQLAVVARTGDEEMERLFAPIDVRK